MTCTLPRQGLYAPDSPPPPPPSTPDFTQSSHTGTNARTCTVELGLLILLQSFPCKRRFPVRFRVLTGLTHATLRADCGSCVLARLMHATGLCATGGCRIQASTRDRLVHKSGLCTRHYGKHRANAVCLWYKAYHSVVRVPHVCLNPVQECIAV